MINSKAANKIYDLLVQECGAIEYWRDHFIQCQSEGCKEFRFQGIFGFGGKFWDNDNRWYINCYPENMTPQLQAKIDEVNLILKKMKEEEDGNFRKSNA